MVLSCLIGIVVLSIGYEYSRAEPEANEQTLKIGVVSVRRVFRDCKRNLAYRADTLAEQSKIREELQTLSKEIAAAEAGLKTLKAGSDDHLAQVKTLFEKRARLDSLREYHKQHTMLKDQRWTESLYEEILQMTNELAKQKGLDLVFESDEPEFPASSRDELMLTISTHKLLYSGGCLDITDDVVAQLDAQEGAKP